ncbi:PAS domain-containing protein, partial [Acidobacteria bacterium ACD]|nr:PAS domain-containing protein [Acidobacteria bacterium ACD]
MPRKHPSKDAPAPSRPDLLDVLASGFPPAFATDADERIVFWNKGAEELLGHSAEKALGRPCFAVVGGRDLYGNRFCHHGCSVVSATRDQEPVNSYEFTVPAGSTDPKHLNVTVVQIPGQRPELFTIVHILQQVDHGSRLATLLRQLEGPKPGETLTPLSVAPPPVPDDPPLTDREREILHWVAAGLQNKEIAHKLDISLATVRNHIHRILEKLEVHSKLEAVSLAFRRGWVA